MRSVRRREFQESFDRYLQIVEKIIGKHKKIIWPPFRLPGFDIASYEEIHKKLQQPSHSLDDTPIDLSHEIDAFHRLEHELDHRWNLLNTKIIHAIYLNVLYDVFNSFSLLF